MNWDHQCNDNFYCECSFLHFYYLQDKESVHKAEEWTYSLIIVAKQLLGVCLPCVLPKALPYSCIILYSCVQTWNSKLRVNFLIALLQCMVLRWDIEAELIIVVISLFYQCFLDMIGMEFFLNCLLYDLFRTCQSYLPLVFVACDLLTAACLATVAASYGRKQVSKCQGDHNDHVPWSLVCRCYHGGKEFTDETECPNCVTKEERIVVRKVVLTGGENYISVMTCLNTLPLKISSVYPHWNVGSFPSNPSSSYQHVSFTGNLYCAPWTRGISKVYWERFAAREAAQGRKQKQQQKKPARHCSNSRKKSKRPKERSIMGVPA